MPIGNLDGYATGHFARVYEHIIAPACVGAGFSPIRADDVNRTNDIAIDVLRRLLDSPMAVCDLSARNPNVMYELGLRHAFNKAVTIVKDSATARVFDIQGLRDLEYDAALRVDTVGDVVRMLAERIANTYQASIAPNQSSVNSLVQLLGLPAARAPEPVDLSTETELILSALEDLGLRLSRVERAVSRRPPQSDRSNRSTGAEAPHPVNQLPYVIGETVNHHTFGNGVVTSVNSRPGIVSVDFGEPIGSKNLVAKYASLTQVASGVNPSPKDPLDKA
jgi:hypothetical protein